MRESKVEAYLKQRVEETGGLVRKVQWIGRRGAPDRLVGWPDQPWARPETQAFTGAPYREAQHALVETKPPGGKPRPEQVREHERLRAIGFDVRVIDTVEKVDAFIEEMVG